MLKSHRSDTWRYISSNIEVEMIEIIEIEITFCADIVESRIHSKKCSLDQELSIGSIKSFA